MIKNAHSLNPGKMVELLTVDFYSAPGRPSNIPGNIVRLSNSVVEFGVGPTLAGNYYEPGSFQITGISLDAGGKIPEPTLKIKVDDGKLGGIVDYLNKGGDPRGARVIRTIVNEDALLHRSNTGTDPSNRIEQVFYINQMAERNSHLVTFKLSTSVGLDSIHDKVNRTLSTNQCNKKYRVWSEEKNDFQYIPVEDGGCEWGQHGEHENFPQVLAWGQPYYDAANNQVDDPRLDRCPLSMAGCLKRFPVDNPNQPLPISINLKGSLGVK